MALAQVPDGSPDAAEAVEDETARRLRALEERDREREAQLAAALSRLSELEASASAPAEEEAAEEPTAPQPPPLTPVASMVTRAELRDGYDRLGVRPPGCFPGDGDCIRYRARLGLQTAPLTIADGVRASIRFLPQVAGYWALPGLSGASSSGGVTDPALGLHEGFLSLHLGRAVRADIGRFEMIYGEHLIIGNLDWHPNGRAFDGARVRIQPDEEGLWVDAFWTVLNESGLPSFGHGDRYFYGVYAGLGPAITRGMHLDAYLLGLQTNDSVDPSTGEQRDWSLRMTAGGRFRHRVDIVDMRAEAGVQLGREGAVLPGDPRLVLAGHVNAEVGLSFAEDRFRVALEGAFASGDDPNTPDVNEAWDQLFPTAHAFLGLSDVMGPRTNVTSGVLHLMGKPLEQLQLLLDVHVFFRPQPGAAASDYAGSEGNLHLIWRPGLGLRFRTMYALFVPNAGAFAPGAGSDPVHYLEVELAYVTP